MSSLRIFTAVFFTGAASLQMELSVLREASFALGSTAFTNSFIISIFLAGLAIGSYTGNYGAMRRNIPAKSLFYLSQSFNIITILFFLFTKGFILYGHWEKPVVLCYFALVTIIPSFVSGMAFSLFLHMLYAIGEKQIALVYAISTLGNVISGLCHGILLVPYFGMIYTYIAAIISTGIAILLMMESSLIKSSVAILFFTTACASALYFKPLPKAIKKSVLYSKDDINGLVQVHDRSKAWKGADGSKGINMFVHNRHNVRSYAGIIPVQRSVISVYRFI